MSAVDLSAIASALATLFEDRIQQNINRAVVLSQLLPVKAGTSKNISWIARFGTATPAGAVIADGADVSVYNSDTKVPATLDYGTYHDAFSITGKARAAAAVTGNPAELADLYAEEIEESVTRLASAIGVDIYDGDGSANTIMGFLDSTNGAIIATGTYANVARGSYAQWAGNVLSNGGTPRALSITLMREMRRTIYTASGLRPDLIVTDPIQHEKYGELLGTERRYMQDVYLRGEKITLDGGYQVLEFDGIPVVEDINCPAGNMLFLNTNTMAIRPLPQSPDSINRGLGMIGLHGTPEEQYGAGKDVLTARINPLAITGDAYKFQLICYPQLQVRRCNANGYIADLQS